MSKECLQPLAVFDVCGTLYTCNTLFSFVSAQPECSTECMIANSFAIKGVEALCRDFSPRRTIMLTSLKKISSDEVYTRAERFTREVLPPFIRSSAATELESRKENGYRIVLLSAAPDFLVQPIAQAWNADGFYSSIYRNGKLMFDMTGKKHEFLKYFHYDSLYVCTDNLSDLSLLRKAQERTIYTKKRNKRFWANYFSVADMVEVE